MTARSLLSTVVIGLGIAVPLSLAAAGQQPPAAFAERVAWYVDLHHAAVHRTGVDAPGIDPMTALRREWALAATLRDALKKPGQVFTPEVAAFFRTRLADAARETGYEAVIPADVPAIEYADEEGDTPPVARLEVGGVCPYATVAEAPRTLLWRLPPLPMELEYRIVGTAFALVDARTGVIVDILEGALPAQGARTPLGATPRPCDVHPDLPACWS
jgi:hypothetical protein